MSAQVRRLRSVQSCLFLDFLLVRPALLTLTIVLPLRIPPRPRTATGSTEWTGPNSASAGIWVTRTNLRNKAPCRPRAKHRRPSHRLRRAPIHLKALRTSWRSRKTAICPTKTSKNYMPSSWNGAAPSETSWYDADPAVKRRDVCGGALSPRQRIFGCDTRVCATGCAASLAKSTTARVKAACFQLFTKAPKANSFVLDTDHRCCSSPNNPPIEGRIPDAI